jgi:hypothetical protein
LPKIGERFGEWSEAPSYEEGVGVDGRQQGKALQKKLAKIQRPFSCKQSSIGLGLF